MKRIRGLYHYEMPGWGLWTDSTLMGKTWRGAYDGCEIEVTLPETADSFGATASSFEESALTGSSSERGAAIAIGVRIIRVAVHAEVEFDAVDFQKNPSIKEAAYETCRRLQRTADSYVQSLLQRIRVNTGQFWLGSSSDIPRTVLLSELLDHAGKRIPVGVQTVGKLVVRGVAGRLMQDQFSQAAEDASKNTTVNLAEELLANAKYMSGVREPADLRYATLLAAIACEAKTKSVLIAKTNKTQRPLIDLILENPRDVSIAMITHLDKTIATVCARSLRVDDPELWKATTNLFKDRNRIAHGKLPQPSEEELRAHVKTASRVFAWLAAL